MINSTAILDARILVVADKLSDETVGDMPLGVKAVGDGSVLGSTRGQLPYERRPFFLMPFDIRTLQERPYS